MLRYKKHKRQADGLGSSVTLMDDTDREVSSFTDRAFRSLCVAEEEAFNDVPHLPSPIRGMPLSTKYHLGIFNLSVRKTQPLAQLPTTPRQRGKWAPTFQPLLNSAKLGFTDVKTNNKLCAPVPRGYKQRSKVSSLIKTFDNIENEIPDDSNLHARLPFSKGSQRDRDESPVSETVERTDLNNESLLESSHPDDPKLNASYTLHRRTAREVFLESQTEMCPHHSRSPSLSPGSPIADQVKKVVKQRDSLRRTAFLHSEHSAFKSWSDINRRTFGGDDSDSSIPGTPPIPRSATPCSPLLQRAIPGIRARDGGIEFGWTSPASTVSSSYDPHQMLRTVPPLPTRKKQNKDSGQKTARTPLNTKNQDVMKTDEGHSSNKEQINWMDKVNKCKSPEQLSQDALPNNGEVLSNTTQPSVQQSPEDQEKIASIQQIEDTSKEEVKEQEKDKPPPGRIKTLIEQMEKESVKDMVPVHLPDKKHSIRELPKEEVVNVSNKIEKSPAIASTTSSSNDLVPPWRKMKSGTKNVTEKKTSITSKDKRETNATKSHENIPVYKEDLPEEKPSSFNISNLLTPVIRRKNIQEALDENIVIDPAVTITTKDQDQRDLSLYQKRNDYKSKATSLLFNLKDMRKRVKSTYNPPITPRNGFENHLIPDVKMQDSGAHHVPLPEVNKLDYDIENSIRTHFAETLRSTRESEIKNDSSEKESENYLSLSPMDQITGFQNGEVMKENVHSNLMKEKNPAPTFLETKDNGIRKEVEYPSLNLYSKENTYVGEENRVYAQDSVPCLKNTVVHPPLEKENVTEEIKPDECIEVASPPLGVLDTSMENVPRQNEQCFPSQEIESQWVVECDESEKQVVKDDENKEILQYFAISSSNGIDGEESNGKSNDLESHNEKEGQEKLTDEKPRAESICAEEIRRPSSITSFKPNLFNLKDNKIKSSPVTKSVRLSLFRSLSEDCLVSKTLEDNNFRWRVGDLRDTRESIGISTDLFGTKNMEMGKVSNQQKHKKHIMASPTLEALKHEAIEFNKIKTQKEEMGGQVIWKKDYGTKQEEESSRNSMTKVNLSKESPCLEESFFHPVETCVSEITGPSPECNTLIVHNVSESMKEQVNGGHIGSPYFDAENTNDSPIDNGLLQFEDSVSFAEDIACSTVTSPMSESVTCSIVTSPMSVNTQSSGFTTALSALEDLPSPHLSSVKARNDKFNFVFPERITQTDSDPKNTDLKPDKAPSLELQKMHAKPPAVPPKTEKALRRAKRLTKKRRKTEIPLRAQDGDAQESDVILDGPLPGNVTPTLLAPLSHHKLMSCRSRTSEPEDIISESSTPSLPPTQRKLLQDPDSGQYFMVEIPVCLRIKTFYDPETGKYLQMSLPTSERESPASEMSNNAYMRYPGLTPVPVSSIASFKGASHLLNHDDTCETESLWSDRMEDALKMNNFIRCDSRNQRMTGTPMSMDRFPSRSSDIISMKDIDDFAMEAVS